MLLLEKTAFPREKVCGDGLTPRAVRELITLGIPTPEEDGWITNHGLRIIGGGMRLRPAVARPRQLPAVRPGPHRARTSTTSSPGTRTSTAPGCASAPTSPARCSTTAPARIVGVTAKPVDDDGPRDRRRARPTARRWSSPPTATPAGCRSSMGRPKRDDRPMGVAVRTYYTSPRHDDDYLESWLELWSTDDAGKKVLLPGYGWIFGVGDGTSNVGLGILNTSKAFGKVDYKDVLQRWVDDHARGVGLQRRQR